MFCYFFFFNDTATTEIYTLSLHDALPIFLVQVGQAEVERLLELGDLVLPSHRAGGVGDEDDVLRRRLRSEEHTSELQSRQYLVCRLLLEKKKEHLLVHSPPQYEP